MLISRLILITVICTVSTGLYSQDCGIKAGLEVSEFNKSGPAFYSDHREEKMNYYTQYRIGVFKKFSINNTFGIQPEIYYVKKGSKIRGHHWFRPETEFTASYRLTYIEMPVLMHYTMPAGSSSLYFTGGPYMALRLKGRLYERTEKDGQKFDDDPTYKVTDDFKPLDLGFTIGFGANLKTTQESLRMIIEIRYSHGLTNINDIQNSKLEIKNRSFSFMLGMGF